MNLQQGLVKLALLGAEWVMWFLVGLSVIGLVVIVERLLYFFSSRGDPETLKRQMMELLGRGEVAAARKGLEESPCVEAQIAAACLRGNQKGSDARIKSEVQLARLKMEHNLTFLGTLGNNAPFVGLLGTVIGIIGAFAELDSSGGQVTMALMGEIGEALVVTGLGLVVALPAVASFNMFQRVIQTRVERGEALAQAATSELIEIDTATSSEVH